MSKIDRLRVRLAEEEAERIASRVRADVHVAVMHATYEILRASKPKPKKRKAKRK